MARHARETLTRDDHFGEEVIYRFASGATPRTIRAVVNRLDIEQSSPGAPQVGRRRAIVFLSRDAELGVVAIESGDQIECSLREGDAARVARIRRVVEQDPASFTVEIEA
jgi:hypothetical protein